MERNEANRSSIPGLAGQRSSSVILFCCRETLEIAIDNAAVQFLFGVRDNCNVRRKYLETLWFIIKRK